MGMLLSRHHAARASSSHEPHRPESPPDLATIRSVDLETANPEPAAKPADPGERASKEESAPEAATAPSGPALAAHPSKPVRAK